MQCLTRNIQAAVCSERYTNLTKSTLLLLLKIINEFRFGGAVF
jgi:hypothetical protein